MFQDGSDSGSSQFLGSFPHPVRGQLEYFPEFASLCMISRTFNSLFKVLFIFPSRYLFTIGLQLVFSLRRWSAWIHAEFHVFRITWDTSKTSLITLTGLSPSLVQFSKLISFSWSLILRSHNPIEVNLYGLDCSAFARHYLRNLFDFFSSAYWDVSLQRVYRCHAMNSHDIDHDWPGFPIRKSTDQRVFVAPRGLSQLTTSFIVFWSQGIHLCALSSLITKRSNLITKRTWLFQ